MVCRARTRSSLAPSDVQLDVTESTAAVSVAGVRTLWSGTLTGRVEPSGCRAEIVRVPGRPWDGLHLTLAKADDFCWRAPYLELLAKA